MDRREGPEMRAERAGKWGCRKKKRARQSKGVRERGGGVEEWGVEEGAGKECRREGCMKGGRDGEE